MRNYGFSLSLLAITATCTGMEKEENPYRNLATCYSDTPLPQFLDEPATYNLMLTNKQLLHHIQQKSAIYNNKFTIEIPPHYYETFNITETENENIPVATIDKESVIVFLPGNYALAIANYQNKWEENLHLIKYTYDQNKKFIFDFDYPIQTVLCNNYCRNAEKNALLIELQDYHKFPFSYYNLVLNNAKVIQFPYIEDYHVSSRVSYNTDKHVFHIQKNKNSIHPSMKYLCDTSWETHVTPSAIIHDIYYTTISGNKIGLANFDFIPLFKDYLLAHASKKDIKHKTKQHDYFAVQITEYTLGEPIDFNNSLYDETEISTIKDFCNTDMQYCSEKGYVATCGFDSLKLATIIFALCKSGDTRYYPQLRNELVDIIFCPIPSNANLEINALGNKRTKKSGIFAFFEKDSYIYDKNNRSFSDEAYEAIVPAESIKNLHFDKNAQNKKHNALLPFYTTPKELVQYISNLAKNKAKSHIKK
jgi:hypothetical protein